MKLGSCCVVPAANTQQGDDLCSLFDVQLRLGVGGEAGERVKGVVVNEGGLWGKEQRWR